MFLLVSVCPWGDVCMVAHGGVHGCSQGRAWLLPGGHAQLLWGGHAWLLLGGVREI